MHSPSGHHSARLTQSRACNPSAATSFLAIHSRRPIRHLRHLLSQTTRSGPCSRAAIDHGGGSASTDMVVKITGQEVGQSKDAPMARSGHCAALLPASASPLTAIIFGGYTEDADKKRQPTNKAFAWNESSSVWSPVQYAAGPVPQPRLTSQALLVGEEVWIIAGWDGAQGFLSDIWALDCRTWAWRQVQLAGETMPQISRFQACLVGRKIYIHSHRSIEDIHVIDTEAGTLAKIQVHGLAQAEVSTPLSRGLHSMTAVGNCLYVFGGAPQSGPMFDDLWRLELDSMTWQQLYPAGAPPAPRCSQAAAALLDRFIVFFGGAFYKALGQLELVPEEDKLLCYDCVSNAYLPVQVAGHTPCHRNAGVMLALPSGDLLCHGGWKPFQLTYNDTHKLSVGI